jgi:hypothetical protein
MMTNLSKLSQEFEVASTAKVSTYSIQKIRRLEKLLASVVENTSKFEAISIYVNDSSEIINQQLHDYKAANDKKIEDLLQLIDFRFALRTQIAEFNNGQKLADDSIVTLLTLRKYHFERAKVMQHVINLDTIDTFEYILLQIGQTLKLNNNATNSYNITNTVSYLGVTQEVKDLYTEKLQVTNSIIAKIEEKISKINLVNSIKLTEQQVDLITQYKIIV